MINHVDTAMFTTRANLIRGHCLLTLTPNMVLQSVQSSSVALTDLGDIRKWELMAVGLHVFQGVFIGPFVWVDGRNKK